MGSDLGWHVRGWLITAVAWLNVRLHALGFWLDSFDPVLVVNEAAADQAWFADKVARSNAFRDEALAARQAGAMQFNDKTLADYLASIMSEPRPADWRNGR